MKIMILVPSFGKASPIHGAFLFAKYLHKQHIEVLFVSLDENYNSKESIIKEIVQSGIRFECLNVNGWSGFLLNRSRVQDYVRKEGVNIVLAYLLRPTLIAASLVIVVKIASVRGMLATHYTLKYGKFISKIAVLMEMRALKKMDYIFSMTGPMTEWLLSEGVSLERISIANNFVDASSIRSSVKREWPLVKTDINIGIFCDLIPRKRVDIAILAMGKLIHDYDHEKVKLHIAGDGELRGYLTHLVKELKITDKVLFHGFLANPLKLMNAMNLVILTSEAEGMPRCLMEALSLGKTVIASDIPGIKELILNKHTGYLFPVGDVEKLTSLINSVVHKEAYLPPERLVDFMLKNYDINVSCKNMLNQVEKVYRERKAAKG